MRSIGNTRGSLMAAAMIAALGAGMDVAGPPLRLRDAGSGNNRRTHQPKRNTALEREIADHNAEVDRRRREKLARRVGAKP